MTTKTQLEVGDSRVFHIRVRYENGHVSVNGPTETGILRKNIVESIKKIETLTKSNNLATLRVILDGLLATGAAVEQAKGD
jgi:sRNA-binding carbon storage regulator CsrA